MNTFIFLFFLTLLYILIYMKHVVWEQVTLEVVNDNVMPYFW